jgi:hypothetical protein
MKKQKSIYDGNKKIMEDEAAYPDYNTVRLLDLLAELAVDTAIAAAKALHNIDPPPPPPNIDDTQ